MVALLMAVFGWVILLRALYAAKSSVPLEKAAP
jgi:hypothetical protein